jgi:hypothetical protein
VKRVAAGTGRLERSHEPIIPQPVSCFFSQLVNILLTMNANKAEKLNLLSSVYPRHWVGFNTIIFLVSFDWL